MSGIINPYNPVMQFIGKIGYSIYLNLLWCICSIPIITIGAATTALFATSEQLATGNMQGLTSHFFSSFKRNFLQSTTAWILLAAGGAVLAVDGYVLYHVRFDNLFWTIICAAFFVAAAGYAIVAMYLFPLMSHFENSLWAMFKNSLLIGMRFLVCTVLMAAIYGSMAWLTVMFFTPLLFLGMGFIALLCSYLLSGVFSLCESNQEPIEKEAV